MKHPAEMKLDRMCVLKVIPTLYSMAESTMRAYEAFLYYQRTKL